MDKAVPKDKGWSWLCTIGAAICMLFSVGTMKSLGILFVEFLEKYKASDAVTAWLLGITSFCMSILAPIANHFAFKFSSRLVVAVATFSCAIAFLLASMAPNIYSVVCFFGIFFGIGFAGMFGPSLMMIGIYFEKRRACANGLAMAGGSLGQLVVPLLMSYLIHEYTLKGALVIYAAVQLHGLVAAMLLRPPEFYTRRILKDVEKMATKSTEICPKFASYDHKHNTRFQLSSESLHNEDRKAVNKVLLTKETSSVLSSHQITTSNYLNVEKTPSELNKNMTESDPCLNILRNKLKREDNYCTSKETLCVQQGNIVPSNLFEEEKEQTKKQTDLSGNNERAKENPKNIHCNIGGIICSLWKLYQWHHCSNTLFIIFALCMSIGCSNYVNHFIFIPARAIEIGIGKEAAAQLLSIIGIADLIGRISGGVIADLSFINRGYLMGGTIMFTGVTSIVSTAFPSYMSLVILCIVVGIVAGTFVSLLAVVIIDFLGLDSFSSAFGLSVMFQGLFNVIWPSFLGWVKDYTGSYEASFYIAGSCLVLSGSFMFFEKCARRIEARKKSKSGDILDSEQIATNTKG